jgi:hypothetical protein
MKDKAIAAACVISLLIGITIGFAVDRSDNPVPPQPIPVPAPTPDPVPDTPVEGQPIKVQVGELVKLTEAEGGRVAWTVEPPIEDLETFGDRNESSVSSYRREGQYTVIAAIADSKGFLAFPAVRIKRYTVHVGAFVPAPAPKPLPNPEPNPGPLPEPAPVPASNGFAGLAKLAPNAAEAQKLAASFREVAKEVQELIDARKLMPLDDIIELTRVANNEALGSSVDKWQPVFTQLEAQLNTLAKDNKLNTMADHVKTWNEIATALESVR